MLLDNTVRLPVTIPDLSYGLKEAVGLLHANNHEIVLELQEQDAFVGALKSGIGTYKISFDDIESVELEKKLMGVHLIISANSMDALKDIPGSKQGQCIFKIERKDKKKAEDAVSMLKMRLSEAKLKNMDDEES